MKILALDHSDSKFGIPEEFIKDLIKMDEKGKIKVTGLHIHTGSDIIKNNQFDEGIKKYFQLQLNSKELKVLIWEEELRSLTFLEIPRPILKITQK